MFPFATTANVVEFWEEEFLIMVEASVNKVWGGVLLGKDVDCVVRASIDFSAIDCLWDCESNREGSGLEK